MNSNVVVMRNQHILACENWISFFKCRSEKVQMIVVFVLYSAFSSLKRYNINHHYVLQLSNYEPLFYFVFQLRMNPTTRLEWSLAPRSSMSSIKWSNCRFGTLQDKKGSGREKSQNNCLRLRANVIPSPSFSTHFRPCAHMSFISTTCVVLKSKSDFSIVCMHNISKQ